MIPIIKSYVTIGYRFLLSLFNKQKPKGRKKISSEILCEGNVIIVKLKNS
jgi:hypothetical protein